LAILLSAQNISFGKAFVVCSFLLFWRNNADLRIIVFYSKIIEESFLFSICGNTRATSADSIIINFNDFYNFLETSLLQVNFDVFIKVSNLEPIPFESFEIHFRLA